MLKISKIGLIVAMLFSTMVMAADEHEIKSRLMDIRHELDFSRGNISQSNLDQIYLLLGRALDIASISSRGGRAEIINACADVFGTGSAGNACIQSATNAQVVLSCGRGFGTGTAALNCATHANNENVIDACVRGFGAGSVGYDCAINAFNENENVIDACVSEFGTGSAGISCAKSASSASIVETCVSRFGTGSAGLRCAIEN